MLLLGNVQASEDLPRIAAPVGLAKWSSGLVEDTMKSVKSGRPRLDSDPAFVRRFAKLHRGKVRHVIGSRSCSPALPYADAGRERRCASLRTRSKLQGGCTSENLASS